MTKPSILDLITERETAAGMTAERLREQIATLTGQLTAAETRQAQTPRRPPDPGRTRTRPVHPRLASAVRIAHEQDL